MNRIGGMNQAGSARERLRRQRLASPPLKSAGDVIRLLGAVQSQEYAAAKWSIGQRARGVSDADIEQELAAGTILRTHVLRPTWHFVLPADIRWMLQLTAPRIRPLSAHRHRTLELDDRILARARAALENALGGGVHLTRAEVQEILARHRIDAASERLGHIMLDAELAGLVCSGAPKGRRQTYALLEERAPHARVLDRDEALAGLTRRYFTSHGPATLKDYTRWATLTMADARRGVELLGVDIESLEGDGVTLWRAGTAPAASRSAHRVHLLQGYDEYVNGYGDTRSVFDIAGRVTMPSGRMPFTHAIILDGQIVGHWRRAPAGAALLIEAMLLRALDRDERGALDDAADRYRAFLGLTDCTVRVS